MKIIDRILAEQEAQNNKTEDRLILLGEIDYDALGGYEEYHFKKNLYWDKRFSKKTYFEIANKYDLDEYTAKKYYKEFDDEVNKPVLIYD